MSTLKSINVIHPSSAVNNIVNDASGNVAVGGTLAMASSFKRNILINGNYLINQRGYVSGTATASGTYMHDRWKSTTTSSNYTFTQGTPNTTITIVAGTIAQIVEDNNVVGGVYTFSWSGTATARIAINGAATSGAYAASPITTASATAGQQITVEFSTGTVGLVQLEVGSIATPYEMQIYSDQLAQCQRYLPAFSYASGVNPYMFAGMVTSLSSSSVAWFTCQFPVTTRVPATGITVSSAAHFAAFLPSTGTVNATSVTFGGSTSTGGNFNIGGLTGMTAGNSTLLYFNNASALMYFTGCEL